MSLVETLTMILGEGPYSFTSECTLESLFTETYIHGCLAADAPQESLIKFRNDNRFLRPPHYHSL